MIGASPEEVREMAAAQGSLMEEAPHATGGGFFITKGNPTILYENGLPGMRRLDHQGPYIKYQVGKKVTRIPLQGNPALP